MRAAGGSDIGSTIGIVEVTTESSGRTIPEYVTVDLHVYLKAVDAAFGYGEAKMSLVSCNRSPDFESEEWRARLDTILSDVAKAAGTEFRLMTADEVKAYGADQDGDTDAEEEEV